MSAFELIRQLSPSTNATIAVDCLFNLEDDPEKNLKVLALVLSVEAMNSGIDEFVCQVAKELKRVNETTNKTTPAA